MLQDITIRPMQEKDIDAVAALEEKCFSEPWSKAAFQEAISKEYYSFYVAYKGDRHVGTVAYTKSFDEADISNVAVDEEVRYCGIAYQLLSQLMNDGYVAGIRHYTLEVRSKNVPAIGLYKKLGFISEGVRPGFYTNPSDDAIIMWHRDFNGI